MDPTTDGVGQRKSTEQVSRSPTGLVPRLYVGIILHQTPALLTGAC